MMKWKKRMGAAFAAALMAASLTVACVPVWATEGTGTTSSASVYTAVSGGTTEFTKHLLMDSDANTPNATFEYKVTAGTAMALNDENNTSGFEILAGVTPENVVLKLGSSNLATNSTDTSIYLLKYSVSDTATAGVNGTTEYSADAASTDHTESGFTTNKKCVWKKVTVDFSTCSFTQPGVYRYILTESGTNQGVTNDSALERYIDVYVIDNGGNLKVDSYVMHTEVNTTYTETTDEKTGETVRILVQKSSGFVNTYDTSNLTFRKEVSGNQASKDKYFKFTVTISNAEPGTKYNVDISTSASATTATEAPTSSDNRGKNNPTEIVMPKEGEAGYDATTGKSKTSVSFYLKHNQEITIEGLAADTSYEVTEDYEDYTQKSDKVNDYKNPTSGRIGLTGVTGTAETELSAAVSPAYDVKTSYINDRSGTIPTGIILTIAPFAAAVLIGGLGLVLILMKKRKAQES